MNDVRSTNSRLLLFGVASLVIVVGVLTVLSVRRPRANATAVSHPALTGESRKPAARPGLSPGGDLALSPREWQIPSPEMTDMQPEVRDLLIDARARVLADPESAVAWANLATVCHVHKLTDCAEICYRRADALAPNKFSYTYLLAFLLDREGPDAEEVASLYEKAAKLKPDYAQVHQRLGDTRAKQGKLTEALDAYLKAVELAPNLGIAHRSAGQTYLALGDVPSAKEALEHAAELTPQDGAVFAALSRVYMALGDRAQAEQAAEKSRSLERVATIPDPIVHAIFSTSVSSPVCYERAKNLLNQGKYAEALPQLKIVERARPNDALVQSFLGSVYINTDQLDLAEQHLVRALELEPERVSANMQLGEVRQKQGRIEEAIAHYRRAQQAKPDHHDINLTLGNALVRNRQFADAVEAYAGTDPAGAVPAVDHVFWGFALRQTGGAEAALEHFRTATQLSPRYANAHYQLGITLEKLGRVKEAVSHYEEAVRIDPNHKAARRLAKVEGN
ncbi:MAG: tetratricopeptide repeat protein [Phycisphaerales bacterium]|nr:MAG: tetratricopeptide repeat protein [Phycisphaerales bacterium]